MAILVSKNKVVQFALLLISVVVLVACASNCQKLRDGKEAFRKQEYRQAFETLMPLAASGNADAQYAVGYMYYYGKGTIEDPDMANNWIRKAAAQGQYDAVHALEVLCFHAKHPVNCE